MMKKGRKLMSLMVAGVMLAGLTGCASDTVPAEHSATTTAGAAVQEKAAGADQEKAAGADQDKAAGAGQEKAAPEAAKKGGKITISQQKAEIADSLKEMAAKYTEETGVEVEIWAQAGDDHYTNLKTHLSSESGPTVFTLNSDAEISEVKDYLADLSSLSFISKIQDDLLAKRDGKTVGIPMTAEGFGLVYNKSLADPARLSSTDSLTAFIKEEAGKGITGLGLSSEDYFLAGHMFNYPFALQKDPAAFCKQLYAGQVKLADVPEFQEYANILLAIRDNQKNPIEVSYDNNCGDFATGKTAMIHQGNWCYSVIAGFKPDFDMGLAGVPIGGNTKICVGVPSVWCVNADAAPEQQLGKDFLNWMYTSDTGTEYLMNEFGFIPVVQGMKSGKTDPLSQTVAQAIASGNILPWTFNTQWPAGIIETELAPITQEFFTTKMSPESFLNKLNDAFVNYGNQ